MSKKRQNSVDRQTSRHFLRMSRNYPRQYYLTLLSLVSSFIFATVTPYLVGKILASIAKPGQPTTPYIVWFAIAALIGVICNRVGFDNYMELQARVLADLQAETLEMLTARGTGFHNNQVSGKLVSDAIDYPAAYMQISNAFITSILPFLIGIVTGLAVITYNSPLLGLIMLVMTSVAIGSGVSFRLRMAPFRARRQKASKEQISHLSDTVVNIHSVKTFAREQVELQENRRLGNLLLGYRIEDWQKMSKDGSNRIAGLLFFELIFIVITVGLVHRQPQLLATGIFAFSFTITLTNRLFEIGSMIRNVEEAFQQAEPVTVALGQAHEVIDVPDATNLKVDQGLIEFKDVTFRYHDSSSEENVFENLTIRIEPGQKVGLVGPSGGGKSTITKLLLRFEDIQNGVIRFDNQDISKVTQQSLRRSISYVPQESLLFHRTIGANIRYGKAGASHEAIVAAAKAAYAHDFITSLPNGYDTVVGERGVKLSGGQRQRIAIARAILKDAPILVLDEATSALDSESEQVIQKALEELMEHRTAVVIAHRLSTIQRLDRIIVLDKGKIVEDGKHKDLVKQGGLYARLWERQSGGFIED